MIKRLLSIIFLFAIITCGSVFENIFAEENKPAKDNTVPKITVSADRAEAHVGDLINLAIKYFIPRGQHVCARYRFNRT